ncbi:MAG: S8 family serine peptidase [Gammaproteobacteria bacterium]|nr:S8 family serine peptidase [Gammaproteobacteria bacterium]
MPFRHCLFAALLCGFVLPLEAQDETIYRSSFENNEVLNVTVDPGLVPVIDSQPGFDGGPPRPLALMRSAFGDGYAFHFVENEVYLITDDPQDLVGFQGRWPSTVLLEVDLDVFATGDTQDTLYLLSVDPSAADPARIREQLEGLTPTLVGDYAVSSESALRLLALAATEIGDHGLRVGINPVLQTDTLARRNIQEAVFGNDISEGSLVYPYDRNPFSWPFTKREDQFPSSYSRPLNTGAAEAVRVVGAAGRLTRNVRVMIADAGFFPNEDYPPFDIVGGLRGTNPVGCGNGPPAPGTVCASHGTHVALTGFARNDNAFGTFGPGGEVADLLLLQSPSMDFAGFVNYLIDGIRAFAANPPDIINISASESIPGGWCFLACEPLDLLIGILRANGVGVVAAAGNDSYDVDATDRFCFIGCVEFEEAAIIPCELDGVLCVGASNAFQSFRTGYSNFGTSGADGNSVDLYAPGNLYSVDALAADLANPVPNDNLQIVTGTSFAAPFTSGVLALTMAANPSFTAIQAETCLRNAAFRPSFGSSSFLAINALGSVSCAMGGSHPFVDLVTPADSRIFLRGAELLRMLANADDYEQGTALTVQWTSSLDGSLGSSAPGVSFDRGLLGMQLGNHQLCANVIDASGRSAIDCVNIEVRSSPPSATILQPTSLASFFVSSSITLSASTSDLDGPAPTGSNVRWYLARVGQAFGAPVATGLNATLAGGSRPPGTYVVKLEVTDSDGETVERTRTIFIDPDPENLPPVVTITSPGEGDSQVYDGTPVRFVISATVSDPEDGSIPFTAIDWSMRVNNGPSQAIELESFQFCFDPPTGPPVCGPITYYIDLVPAGSATSTRFDLKATVQDSGGQSNISSNGRVTVFITQLI